MITQEYAALYPQEHLGRDVYIDDHMDLKINSKDDLMQIRYYDNLKQSIVIRLKTSIGELELHPDYGCRLHELLGTTPNELTLSVAKLHVREALLQEPRIEEIISINPSFREGTSNTTIDINITVKPIEDLAELNLVYSLFI